MSLTPVVRYMILCEDWSVDADQPRRVHIHGLLCNIRPVDEDAYPLLFRESCVFLVLTEARGAGEAQIICVFEESGQRVFGTPKRACVFGADPLDLIGVSFRIRDCQFPQSGLYSIQFWYNDELVEERPLRLR
jgi:hypothetical protein